MGSEVLPVTRQPQSPASRGFANALLLSFDHTKLLLAHRPYVCAHPCARPPSPNYSTRAYLYCIYRLKIAEVEHTVPTAYFTIILISSTLIHITTTSWAKSRHEKE